jgi:hypothetical protein
LATLVPGAGLLVGEAVDDRLHVVLGFLAQFVEGAEARFVRRHLNVFSHVPLA